MAILTSSGAAYADGYTDALSFTSLMSAGAVNNGQKFGLLKNSNDVAITYTDGSPFICDGENGNASGSGLDHVSLLQKDSRLFMVAQFECEVGAMYGFELEQNATNGKLSVKPNSMQYISQKDDFGGWVHCAGMTTPWNSHLGSEEYEPNARTVESSLNQTTMLTSNNYFNEVTKFYWADENNSNATANNNPYFYGYIPEVKVNGSVTPAIYTYTKHFAMGRASWEMAYVMPDNRTAYLGDDGSKVGFFMFIADTAKDLSAGTLYAAKWTQLSNVGAGVANLSWIKLGHSDDATIKAIVATEPKFSDIFNYAAPTGTTCPAGYTYISTSAGSECLNVKAGKETAAAFLETRRYAAMLGATTEYNKEEGVTYNPEKNVIYVAMSAISGTMSDTRGDIQLSQNNCGAVYELALTTSARDTNGVAINSGLVAMNQKGLVAGTPKTYTGVYSAYKCDVDGISNPDNVAYLAGQNILAIGEDTSAHPNDFVWAFDTATGKMVRIASTPYGSETTSPYWHTNVNGYGYMTLTTQHPFGEILASDKDYNLTSNPFADKNSSIGVIGAFKFNPANR